MRKTLRALTLTAFLVAGTAATTAAVATVPVAASVTGAGHS